MDSLFDCLFNRICYNDGNVLYLFSLSTIITHCIIHLKKWIFSFISLNLKFKLLHVAGGYHIGPHNEFCFIDLFSWISHQIHNYHMVEEASKIILRCINNSLTEVSRVVILMVPVHYSERIQIMTSNRKRHIGQSPGRIDTRLSVVISHKSGANSLYFSQKWCLTLPVEYCQPGEIIQVLVPIEVPEIVQVDMDDQPHRWC